jgi:dTDP-4-amino-4,6-dideoxygalactose transaminase
VRLPQRDRVREFLESRGIGTGLHYPLPLHLQAAYRHLGGRVGAYPVVERAAREMMSLPMFPGMTTDQIDQVVDALAAFFVGRQLATAQAQ